MIIDKNILYGRLKIIEDMGIINGRHMVKVECSCEDKTIKIIRFDGLQQGTSKSCGCLSKEQFENTKLLNKKYNTYNLEGQYGIGYDYNNKEFYFDLEDYSLIKDYYWHVNSRGYVVSSIKRKTVNLHRKIMSAVKNDIIDHINRITYDNRKNNLRFSNINMNGINRVGYGKLSKFGLKGILWDKKHNFWIGRMLYNKKYIFNKTFKKLEDAIATKINFEKEYFGEYRYAWENDIKWDLLLEYEKELKGDLI